MFLNVITHNNNNNVSIVDDSDDDKDDKMRGGKFASYALSSDENEETYGRSDFKDRELDTFLESVTTTRKKNKEEERRKHKHKDSREEKEEKDDVDAFLESVLGTSKKKRKKKRRHSRDSSSSSSSSSSSESFSETSSSEEEFVDRYQTIKRPHKNKMLIEVHHPRSRVWHRAKISRVKRKGRHYMYDVKYEDGDLGQNIQHRYTRIATKRKTTKQHKHVITESKKSHHDDEDTNKFLEGSHVMFRTHRGVRGQWKWSRGRVINVYPDRRDVMLKDGTNIVQTVRVSRIQDDEDEEESKKRSTSPTTPISPESIPHVRPVKGLRVSVWISERRRWILGKIAHINHDGTCDVLFMRREPERGVTLDRIRPAKDHSSLSSRTQTYRQSLRGSRKGGHILGRGDGEIRDMTSRIVASNARIIVSPTTRRRRRRKVKKEEKPHCWIHFEHALPASAFVESSESIPPVLRSIFLSSAGDDGDMQSTQQRIVAVGPHLMSVCVCLASVKDLKNLRERYCRYGWQRKRQVVVLGVVTSVRDITETTSVQHNNGVMTRKPKGFPDNLVDLVENERREIEKQELLKKRKERRTRSPPNRNVEVIERSKIVPEFAIRLKEMSILDLLSSVDEDIASVREEFNRAVPLSTSKRTHALISLSVSQVREVLRDSTSWTGMPSMRDMYDWMSWNRDRRLAFHDFLRLWLIVRESSLSLKSSFEQEPLCEEDTLGVHHKEEEKEEVVDVVEKNSTRSERVVSRKLTDTCKLLFASRDLYGVNSSEHEKMCIDVRDLDVLIDRACPFVQTDPCLRVAKRTIVAKWFASKSESVRSLTFDEFLELCDSVQSYVDSIRSSSTMLTKKKKVELARKKKEGKGVVEPPKRKEKVDVPKFDFKILKTNLKLRNVEELSRLLGKALMLELDMSHPDLVKARRIVEDEVIKEEEKEEEKDIQSNRENDFDFEMLKMNLEIRNVQELSRLLGQALMLELDMKHPDLMEAQRVVNELSSVEAELRIDDTSLVEEDVHEKEDDFVVEEEDEEEEDEVLMCVHEKEGDFVVEEEKDGEVVMCVHEKEDEVEEEDEEEVVEEEDEIAEEEEDKVVEEGKNVIVEMKEDGVVEESTVSRVEKKEEEEEEEEEVIVEMNKDVVVEESTVPRVEKKEEEVIVESKHVEKDEEEKEEEEEEKKEKDEDEIVKDNDLTKQSGDLAKQQENQPKEEEEMLEKEEDWELEKNQNADSAVNKKSVQDLLSLLESNNASSSSSSSLDKRRELKKEKKKRSNPPHVEKQVHDLLSSMVKKKQRRSRKLSLKNTVHDLIKMQRHHHPGIMTPMSMATHAHHHVSKRTPPSSSKTTRKPNRSKTHHHLGTRM